MEKQIKKIKQLNFDQQMTGFKATGVKHSEYNTEPYLIFGEFYMDRSVFGPHAHAGVSVMTYVLPDSKGSFLNRDSLGDHSIIDPGGVHVRRRGAASTMMNYRKLRERNATRFRSGSIMPIKTGW